MAKQKIENSDWLTKPEAVALLGCSERHIDRLVQRGELQISKRKIEGGVREVSVFHPQDLEQIKNSLVKTPGGFVMSAEAAEGLVPVRPSSSSLAFGPDLASQLAALAAMAARFNAPGPSTAYVSLKTAAEITGLSRPQVKAAGLAGEVKTRASNGGIVYRRVDLEAL